MLPQGESTASFMSNSRHVLSFKNLCFLSLISSYCSKIICTVIQNNLHMGAWRSVLPLCEETSAGMQGAQTVRYM